MAYDKGTVPFLPAIEIFRRFAAEAMGEMSSWLFRLLLQLVVTFLTWSTSGVESAAAARVSGSSVSESSNMSGDKDLYK
jgi:hypothetical protein